MRKISKSAEIEWQEAIARLVRERSLAETSAQLLKKIGDAAVVDRGAFMYGEAKAEYDGIIGGLLVALARKEAPGSLVDLEARLIRAFQKRQAFCESVQQLLPAPVAGSKDLIEEAVKGAVGPLLDGLRAIWMRCRDDNAMMRKTIETRLEAATWPDFATVAPTR